MRSLTPKLVLMLVLALAACGPAGPTAADPVRGNPAAPASGTGGASSSGTASTASAPAAASTSPDAGQPTELRKLELAMATGSGAVAPIWIAADYGIFRRYGLDVQPIAMAAATATQTLSSGSVLIAVTGGSSATAWVGGATDLVFVAGLSNKAVWEVLGRPEIARLEDLRGQSIGASTAGSGASIALFETLRRFGLEPERDVAITYLREDPARVAALLSGNVQGAVLASPFTQQARAQGARLLVDMRDLDIPMVALNITTTRGLLEREPDLVRRFLMGYVEGLQYMRDQPSDAIASILRGTRGESRADAEIAYQTYRDVLSPWPSEKAIQMLLDNLDAPEAKTARPAAMIDDRLLRELEASGWLAAHYSGSD
jgi:NitT/TauT family transport system substrate-binding protein